MVPNAEYYTKAEIDAMIATINATKQAKLSATQLDAVNSGITEAKRELYDLYDVIKQGKLTTAQLNAVNSGITPIIKQGYDLLDDTKEPMIPDEQRMVLQSGLTGTELTRIQIKLLELEHRIEELEGE